MTSYLLILVLTAGLLMYLLCSNSKAQEIGRMLFFSAVLGLMVAVAPATVHWMHG